MGYNQGRAEQGEEAELKVELALGSLKKKGFVLDFIRAKKHGELDISGIDFLIRLFGGMALLLQVKSSKRPARRHYSRYPDISCIIVEPRQSDIGGIERRVRAIMRKKIKNFKRNFSGFLK